MFVCFAPAFCGGFFCAICKAIKKIIRNIFCQLEIFIYICLVIVVDLVSKGQNGVNKSKTATMPKIVKWCKKVAPTQRQIKTLII